MSNLKQQAAERAAELQRMQVRALPCGPRFKCLTALQAATLGGNNALEKELAASLQVISKLEADVNVARGQKDDISLAMSSLEKQVENASARLEEWCMLFCSAREVTFACKAG